MQQGKIKPQQKKKKGLGVGTSQKERRITKYKE